MFLVFAASLAVLPHRAKAQEELPYTSKKPEEPPQPTGSVTPFANNGSGWSAGVSSPNVAQIRPPNHPPIKLFFPSNFIARQEFYGSSPFSSGRNDGYSSLATLTNTSIILEAANKKLFLEVLKDGRVRAKLNDGPVTKLQVLDEKGHILTGFDLHVGPNPKPLDDFFVPSSGAIGSTMDVWVPKANIGDPLRDDMKILIGGREMPNLAASSVDRLTRIDYDTPGPTVIEIKDGNTDYKRPFRVLKLDLSADSLNLLKGESTTVHIVVRGLENLHVPAHMKIVVTGTVTMTGLSEVEIQPSDVSADGTYTTTRTLHAVSAGGFGVNVTVTVDKEIPVVRSNQKGQSNRSRLVHLP